MSNYSVTEPPYNYWRLRLVIVILLLAASGLVTRLTYLIMFDRPFLLKQGNARCQRTIDIPAYRGMVMDRNHQPLAISTPIASVWANVHDLNVVDPRLNQLAKILELDPKELMKRLQKNKKHEFYYIKRSVKPEQAQLISTLKIPGIYLQDEYHRFYPQGEVMAQLIGFTNVDDRGQEGLESAYDNWLCGIPGKKNVVQDRLGRIVEDIHVIKDPKPGNNLILSVDSRIQYIAYRELKSTFEKLHAAAGTVTVLDIKTGEILAMVNQPSFNPNSERKSQNEGIRNRIITDTLEPGSTLKPFSVLNALLHSNITPNTIVETAPGYMMVDNKKVSDIHNYGTLNVTTILQKSSNVGVTKLNLGIPPEHLLDLLHRLGFGERTESHFPGEVTGKLPELKTIKKPFALATLTFGYGLAVTPLQLARAYAILANKGEATPLSLLAIDEPPTNLMRVFPEKETVQVMHMLETVVEEAATKAQVEGYSVAGKTGTTRVLSAKGYEKERHNSIFVGFAPATNPRLVVAITLTDIPGKNYYGGAVAAPVFEKVMSNALRIMNVPPDAPEQPTKP